MILEPALSPAVAAVHRALHAEPASGVADLSRRLGLTETAVRAAIDLLADRALSTVPSGPALPLWTTPPDGQPWLGPAPVAPDRRDDRAREATGIVRLDGAEPVRHRLTELARLAHRECWSLEAAARTQDLNRVATARGIEVCCVYQDAYRDDRNTVAYVRWLADSGGEVRTVPAVPLHVVIIDRRVAVLPVDPADPAAGAVEVTNPSVVLALCALFQHVWATARPITPPNRYGGAALTRTEADVLRLLAEGHTSESAARRLGISGRSVRRIAAGLTGRLQAASRFQAGVAAVRAGWL